MIAGNSSAEYGWTAEKRREYASALAADQTFVSRLAQLWLGNAAEEEAPPLERERAARLQARVIEEIRRGDLSAEALRMATSGFSAVAIALLRPLLTIKMQPDNE